MKSFTTAIMLSLAGIVAADWEFQIGSFGASGSVDLACTQYNEGSASQWSAQVNSGCIVSLYTKGSPNCGADNLIATADENVENEQFEGGSKVIGFYDVTQCE
ncbi:hypothetical protein ACQKWADRAFT_317391 [Trichoderma austrokoningii]